MSNTPSPPDEDKHKDPSPSVSQHLQQADPDRVVTPPPQSLLDPFSEHLDHSQEPSVPSESLPPIFGPLLVEATGGHRVGDPVLRRSGRIRRSRITSSRPQASSSTMVRPSPPVVSSENDSDSDTGTKPAQSAAVSDSRSETELRPRRTRTLTTPHQAAVLHALLAQSRFPTTQMREEVGRAIGMSARKVQIWFQNQRQNQRQKERQEKGEASGAQRPPQYGSFTSGSSGHMPYGMQISTSQSGPISPSSASSPHITGPPAPRMLSAERVPLRREFSSENTPTRFVPFRAPNSPGDRPGGPSGTRRDTLPPLNILDTSPPPRSPLSAIAPGSSRSSHHQFRSARPESPPVYSPGSSGLGAIPRPFTLQPEPIWAPNHPIPRPTTDHPATTGSPLSSGGAAQSRSSRSRTPPQAQNRGRGKRPGETHHT